MKKVFLTLIATALTLVQAQEIPAIVGYIPNKGSGQITFTTSQCTSDPSRRIVFVKDQTGKISLQGCWAIIDDEVWVLWSDGDLYSYPVGAIKFSEQFSQWSDRNNRQKYQ